MKLVLWAVSTPSEHFWLVSEGGENQGDMAVQLAAALGHQLSDPFPSDATVLRVEGRVAGRVGFPDIASEDLAALRRALGVADDASTEEMVMSALSMRDEIRADDEIMRRIVEVQREVLRNAHAKGFAVCSWCATATNADAESLQKHQESCDKSPLVAKLREAQALLGDEIECRQKERVEWQEATGLVAGGDPGGVTPEILRQHQMMAGDVINAAKRAMNHNGLWAELEGALAEYFKRWPEQ